MGGVWMIHCNNYDCPKWSKCDFIKGKIARECKDPKKFIILGELPT